MVTYDLKSNLKHDADLVATLATSANLMIKDISCDAEVGKLYECTVKSILEEGLVIEYNGGRHGLLHISELSTEEVSKVSYVLSVGEHITLKCIKKNFSSITQFSLKAVA
ncbi:hypothetical protein F2Q70_00025696 [Brassica cretica]|uniref:S1 motif domain-containing protein n=1 Tax=Brassica cretica TaxID=69181 RepID=A0A8S9L305_BRACR|nr:hypothetical protein F2Q70_00025696 [Brassica cretica]